MKKTTVYLSDQEAAQLQAEAAKSGVSQSELIRKGVRIVSKGSAKRNFRSMGVGKGTGEPVGRNSEDYLGELFSSKS